MAAPSPPEAYTRNLVFIPFRVCHLFATFPAVVMAFRYLGEFRVDAFPGVRVEGQVVFGQPTGFSQRQAHVLWLYFFIPPAPARIGRKTLTHSSGGSSWAGLDLGDSFGRFRLARRFGRKLQTPFIGFGKGQGQLLSSRLRVLFKKPSPRYRVACATDTDSGIGVRIGVSVHFLSFF